MSPKRIATAIGASVLGLILVGALVWLIFAPKWRSSPLMTVKVSGGEQVTVLASRKAVVYIGFPHAEGIYLSPGGTKVSIADADKTSRFEANEELVLYAVNRIEHRFVLIFAPEYRPGRGFIAYKQDADGQFKLEQLRNLPIEIAYPNANRTEMDRLAFHLADPPSSFERTQTALLWSRMITGKEAVVGSVKASLLADIWRKVKAANGTIDSTRRP